MRARAEHLFARTITRPAVPFRSPAPARRNPDTPVPARRPYRPPRRYPSHNHTPYAPGHHGSWPTPGRAPGNAEQSAPAQSRTITRFAVPVRQDGERRVGTLTRPYRHAGRTVHHGATRAIAVPPTRRGITVPGQRQAEHRATPSNRRRRTGASQSPDAPVRPSRDQPRRTRRPTPRAGRALPG